MTRVCSLAFSLLPSSSMDMADPLTGTVLIYEHVALLTKA